MVYRPDEHIAARLQDSGIDAAIDKIAATVKRFDDAVHAAAASAVPDGPGFDTLLAAIEPTVLHIDMARPELVTYSALARILGALNFIDSELDTYLTDHDVAHLATVLGSGIQNFYRVMRHCFGYWQLPKDPAWAGTIKHLRLKVSIPGAAGPGDAHPRLQLLVDGIEALALVGDRRYHGFPPAEILGADAPLLPVDPARHVPLYIEAGAGPAIGCIAALIHTWGSYIAWNDFRRFDTVYTPAMRPDADDGEPCLRPQVFDGEQYRAEVQRASRERAWDAAPWQPRSS